MREFRGLIIAILILSLGMGVFAVGAQDDLLTNTPAAEVTVEPVVTPAPVVDVPPAENPFAPITDNLMEIILTFAVVVLALQNKNLIPVEIVEKVLGKAFGYAKEVTTKIPGELDDQIVKIIEDAARRIIRDELAKGDDAIETSVDVPAIDSEFYRSKFGRGWTPVDTQII